MQHTKETITVQTTVRVPLQKVWEVWTTPSDIRQWNNPSADWCNQRVELELKDGGAFLFRMKAKDGSQGFDYCGKYDKIKTNELIELTTSDGRKTINTFAANGHDTIITETFEPEEQTPVDLQKDFCASILKSFKEYAEGKLMNESR